MTAVLLDSNIVFHRLFPENRDTVVSAITIAEAANGVPAAVASGDAALAAQRAEEFALLRSVYGDGLPFSGDMAGAYTAVIAAIRRAEKPKRKVDYYIAATALHHGLDLLTTDSDFAPLAELMTVTVLPSPPR